MKKIIIDGNNAILGRLASYAAKQALLGQKVIVVNCDGVVVSGNRRMVINSYKQKKLLGGHSLKGPFFSRKTEKIVKRTIRGMLSYKQGRGLDALKRVVCYKDVPKEYLDSPKIKASKEKRMKTISLLEISKEI